MHPTLAGPLLEASTSRDYSVTGYEDRASNRLPATKLEAALLPGGCRALIVGISTT